MDKEDTAIRILLIEDSPTDAVMIEKAIKKYKKDAQYTHVETFSEGEKLFEEGNIDLLLLDLGLPDTESPKDTYEQIRKWKNAFPVIIMTSLQDHSLAMEMIKDGVADFLTKDTIVKAPKLIQNAIDFALERHIASAKIRAEKEKAEHDSEEKDVVLNCFMGGYSISE